MDIVSRLKFFLSHNGISNSTFADTCDIPRPTLSQLLNGRNKKVSDELITKIHNAYPALNIMWLMFGDGDMFVPNANSMPSPTVAQPSENLENSRHRKLVRNLAHPIWPLFHSVMMSRRISPPHRHPRLWRPSRRPCKLWRKKLLNQQWKKAWMWHLLSAVWLQSWYSIVTTASRNLSPAAVAKHHSQEHSYQILSYMPDFRRWNRRKGPKASRFWAFSDFLWWGLWIKTTVKPF